VYVTSERTIRIRGGGWRIPCVQVARERVATAPISRRTWRSMIFCMSRCVGMVLVDDRGKRQMRSEPNPFFEKKNKSKRYDSFLKKNLPLATLSVAISSLWKQFLCHIAVLVDQLDCLAECILF
jgi:hypothetical protein